MMFTILGTFILLLVMGAPIFAALTVAAFIANTFFLNVPGTMIAQSFYTAVDSWPLLCVPFFLFSGNLMGNCGPASSLFDLCDKLLGHVRGGLPAAVVATCVMFGAVTGSGVATAIAVGTLAIPEMLKRGYSPAFCYGLIAVAGTLGLMIPPSVYMILFAGISNGDILEYFTAGYLPGLFMAACLMFVAIIKSKGVALQAKSSGKERLASLVNALPALGMPVVIMGSIYSGMFTPTESSALSVVYTFLICPVFYKERFSFQMVYDSAKSAAYTTAQTYIILGAVASFSSVLAYMHIPQMISEFVVAQEMSPVMLLFMICTIYFVLGMIVDAVPILFLTVPIFLPVVRNMGISVTHFMVLTTALLMVGQVTPPFGIILFALASHFKADIHVIVNGSVAFLIALIFATAVLIVFPQISTFLPDLLLK